MWRRYLTLILLVYWGSARGQQVFDDFKHPDTVCVDGTVVLTNISTGASNYYWYFCEHYTDTTGKSILGCPAGVNLPSLSVQTPAPYSYRVAGTYAVCLVVDTNLVDKTRRCYNIVVKSAPSIVFGPDTFYCQGQPITLQAPDSPGVRNMWSTGADSNSIHISNPGTYTLTSQYYGCTAQQTTNVTALASPTIQLPRDTVFCDSGVLRYTTTQPVTFLWNTGSIVDSTKVTSSQLYWLQLNQGGCTALDSVTCRVISTHSLNLGPDTSFCGPGGLGFVTFDTTGIAYLWSTGSDSSSTPVPVTGDYWLAFTDAGCTARDTIHIAVLPAPGVNLGRDTTLCLAEPYLLDAGNPGDTYLWQDGSTQETYIVANPGLYSVRVTEGICSVSDSIRIGAVPAPVFTLGEDQPVCPGESIYLKPQPDTLNFTWQNGSTDTVYQVSSPGAYSVTAKNACTTYSDTIQVVEGVCVVHVPTAFTPNGDGINDVFRVLGVEVLDQFSLRVYNRWGATVFASEDKDLGWDGSAGGVAQPSGTYVYELHFRYRLTGQTYAQGGTVVLIR